MQQSVPWGFGTEIEAEHYVHPNFLALPGRAGYFRNSSLSDPHSGSNLALSRQSPVEFSLALAQLASYANLSYCLPLLPGNGGQLRGFRRSLDLDLSDCCFQSWQLVAALLN